MIVYRLSKEEFKNDLSGRGAEKAGGRWNSKGVAMIYTGASRALCTAEIAVRTPLGIVPKNYCLITIEVPDTVEISDIKTLSADWNYFPYSQSTQAIGNKFISEGKYLIMKVPSAVIQGDYNFIINPGHPLIKSVRIIKTEPFEFDKRLFVK